MLASRSLLGALALVSLMALSSGQQVSEGLVADREALLSLRSAITSFGQSKIATWRPTGNPCFPKPWRHVICGGGRVVEINLANRQVAGALPAKLRLADRLITINFEGNRFTGSIPTAWAAKTSFPKLRTLNLAGNELSGELPNWNRVGAWRALQYVDLSNNNFHGGLPANWLGKQRAIRNVQLLDLSNNNLGRANGSVSGDTLPKAQWCQSEAASKLYTGSGWCPTGTPILGTTASLLTLDLSDNGLTGEIPSQWPVMFPQLQYLLIQFNTLGKKDGSGNDLASVLPAAWSSDRKRGFPSLSILTLYPGNEYVCSIPDIDGGFLDVNADATYQVADSGNEVYSTENPWLCPTKYSDDNPPTAPTLLRTAAEWTLPAATDASTDIWGFLVTIMVEDREGEVWSPLTGWSGMLLRSYTHSDDGFSAAAVSAQKLSCTATTCTLDLAARPDTPTYSWELGRARLLVSVVNLDGVESSMAESAMLDL